MHVVVRIRTRIKLLYRTSLHLDAWVPHESFRANASIVFKSRLAMCDFRRTQLETNQLESMCRSLCLT